MKGVFPSEWRTQNRRKRRFYATYMRWLERIGFVVVLVVLAAFIFAFRYQVDDLVSADGVKIEPFATPIDATHPTLVVKKLVHDFDEVRAGQPLMEVAEGDDSIRQYQDWANLQDVRSRVGNSPEIATLLARYPKPSTRTITAPVAGVVRLDDKALATVQDAKATIARVVDYNDLRLSGSLSGQTAPQAKIGQWATVSAVTIEPDYDTLLRAYGAGKPILSGRVLGDSVQKLLQNGLVGKTLALRDDVPLKVTEIKGVQIDAVADDSASGADPGALPLDPPGTFEVQAQVIEGKPAATAQVAVLPSDLSDQATETIRRALKGRAVRQLDGTVQKFDDVRNVAMVVTVKADRQDGDQGAALSGATISRTFDATLKIANPPAGLIQAIRDADKNGKAVTARVDLRTGSRPIALLLLKKS